MATVVVSGGSIYSINQSKNSRRRDSGETRQPQKIFSQIERRRERSDRAEMPF